MSYWGKLLGGMAGFAFGGPFGAVVGAALGHAADSGSGIRSPEPENGGGFGFAFAPGLGGGMFSPLGPAKLAALLGHREQTFAIGVVVLAAKLAKCDGPVKRVEIDAFKRYFSVPPEAVREIGRLFDQARDSGDRFEPYADQLGENFADEHIKLEEVLVTLFAIARADGPVNRAEHAFLQRVHHGFGLDRAAWDRVQTADGGRSRRPVPGEPDAYTVLGVKREASDAEVRNAWRKLMRETHPDSLASKGASPEQITRASSRVAAINAAWDRVKRERNL